MKIEAIVFPILFSVLLFSELTELRLVVVGSFFESEFVRYDIKRQLTGVNYKTKLNEEENIMKKILFIILTAILGMTQTSIAADYRYVAAEELKGWLEATRPVLLVDIQEAKAFALHHIKGALETNAYPVKSEIDRKSLDPVLNQSKEYAKVVVICPRGKGGAKRTYDYLKGQGVLEEKLFILTDGMGKWPYKDWVATK